VSKSVTDKLKAYAGYFISVLLLSFFLFGFLSCGIRGKKMEPLQERLAMRFGENRVISYKTAFTGNGTMIITSQDSGKQEVIKDDFNIPGELSFTGIDPGNARMEWKIRDYRPGSGTVQFPVPVGITIDETGRIKDNKKGYGEMVALAFLLPVRDADDIRSWVYRAPDDGTGSGLIRSRLISRETFGGKECVKIHTEFDITRTIDNDNFRIRGSGLSFFSEKEGRFLAIERKYRLSSTVRNFENKTIQTDQSGIIALELIEDNVNK
jgi:hypothetical protein